MLISEWTSEDVKKWLVSEGFEEYSCFLCDNHGVDGEILLTLSEKHQEVIKKSKRKRVLQGVIVIKGEFWVSFTDKNCSQLLLEKDLRSPPIQIAKLSHIKKLGKSIKVIQEKHEIEKNLKGSYLKANYSQSAVNGKLKCKQAILVQDKSGDDFCSDLDDDGDLLTSIDGKLTKKRVFLPEYKKLMVSFLYAMFASWITAYTMVLVHERVPDKEKYPPLPDIFLDNIPLIPYAFEISEICGLLMGFVFFLILFFHKQRTILLRRFFSISSTVFLLRSVTMFVTSLSVPGKHLNCIAMYNSQWQRFVRATEIVFGFGMSLTGLQTCGDYMFSGHTAYLTLFNHLITEYTPSKLYFVHTIAWVLHLFGLFFILAAHEHYSIDVFIAFYITSRIFLYYHMLANTRSYRYSRRIRIWFPLLSYFECNVPGKVPNEFEWPLSRKAFANGIELFSRKAFKKNL